MCDFEIVNKPKFNCVKCNDNFWFTQKTISTILQITVPAVNEHLKEIYKFKGAGEGCMVFPIEKTEGSRTIKRQIKHYDLSNFYDITARSKRFDEFNDVLTEISQNDKVNFVVKVSPVKERNFKTMLEKALNGIESFRYQYPVMEYRVDFFFPRLNLIIEFDEDTHKKRLVSDLIRQREIESKTNYQFIRVNEGEELEGLNLLLQYREQFNSQIP